MHVVGGLSLTPCPVYQVLGIHGFAFPLLLTSCHMGFSFVILLPFMLCEPYVSKHRPTLEQQWKGLVAIGEAGCPLACLRCVGCLLLSQASAMPYRTLFGRQHLPQQP